MVFHITENISTGDVRDCVWALLRAKRVLSLAAYGPSLKNSKWRSESCSSVEIACRYHGAMFEFACVSIPCLWIATMGLVCAGKGGIL